MSDGMAPLKIYWGGSSPFAWRVVACVEERGFAYQAELLDVSKSEDLPHRGLFSLGSSSLKEERLVPYGTCY